MPFGRSPRGQSRNRQANNGRTAAKQAANGLPLPGQRHTAMALTSYASAPFVYLFTHLRFYLFNFPPYYFAVKNILVTFAI